MAAIQALMNFIFFVVVAGTVLVSFWLSRKYKERYAEFPWGKTGLILAIEVLAWIVFNVLWSWVRAHPWIAVVVAVVIIVILFIRRKKEEELL
jgi:protein-S-isoprenylcysteine O-methyltransferase Ste14